MLHEISWGQFVVAVLVLAGAWWLAVIARYYREEARRVIQHLAKGRKKRDDEGFDDEDYGGGAAGLAGEEDHFVGAAKEPYGIDTVSAHELRFAPDRKALVIAFLLTGAAMTALAQDGAAGIQQATTMVRGYFDAGCNLMYAIGAILGIVGAIKVYRKWNEGDHDTSKVAAAWFGSCIFLVVVATVIKSFFGV